MKKKYLKLGDQVSMKNSIFVVTCISKLKDKYPYDRLYYFNRPEDDLPLSDGYYITELNGMGMIN